MHTCIYNLGASPCESCSVEIVPHKMVVYPSWTLPSILLLKRDNKIMHNNFLLALSNLLSQCTCSLVYYKIRHKAKAFLCKVYVMTFVIVMTISLYILIFRLFFSPSILLMLLLCISGQAFRIFLLSSLAHTMNAFIGLLMCGLLSRSRAARMIFAPNILPNVLHKPQPNACML